MYIPDKYELQRHGRGEDYHESVPPQAIVMPNTTEATSHVAKICAKYKSKFSVNAI
jgi:hypothetical protein